MEDGALITLDVRPTSPVNSASVTPPTLTIDTTHATHGLPWLHGSLSRPIRGSARLVLRIHNRAGIPIIEGQYEMTDGQQAFTCSNLLPLGIEAYAHVSEAQREQTAQRIWSRRAYATLQQYPLEPERT